MWQIERVRLRRRRLDDGDPRAVRDGIDRADRSEDAEPAEQRE
jgi:hypothetical protein